MRSPLSAQNLAAACVVAVLAAGCGRLGYDTVPLGFEQGGGGTVGATGGDSAQAAQAGVDPDSGCSGRACHTQAPLEANVAGAAGAEGNPGTSLAGGGSDNGSPAAAGNDEATGGQPPVGAAASAGESQSTGAAPATGGAAFGSGGSMSGGADSAGAPGAEGGAVDAGGSAPTGGAPPSGGGPATGGDAATGGSLAAGGAAGSSGASASGAGGSTPVDYCREIPALGSSPVLDGVTDPGVELVAVVPVGWRGSGTVPDGYALSYAAAWVPQGLYFFLRVEDPDRNPAEPRDAPYAGDGVEIYVDSDGVFPPPGSWDDPGARQFIVAAPADDTTPSTRAEWYVIDGGSDVWASTSFVCVPTDVGYDLEAFVQAADLGLPSWSLSADQEVGIDLAHNVSLPPGETGPFGNRDSQYFLHIVEPRQNDSYDFPFRNENAFCRATLLEP